MFTAEFLVPDSNQQLMASLVKCLKAVADSYNPAILDTTIPSNLFGALVKLLAVRHPGKYLRCPHAPPIFQCCMLIYRMDSRNKFRLCTCILHINLNSVIVI